MRKYICIGLCALCAAVLAALTPPASAASIRFVTEYVYPTAFDVTPITGTDAFGNNRIIGGIVTPRNFETREVGVAMDVYAEMGTLAGMAAVMLGPQRLNGNTDLMIYATAGDVSAVKRQIDNGADVKARNSFGSTALMGAAAGGFEDVVRLLLRYEPDVNARSRTGNTALVNAARNGHSGIAERLIEGGADVNLADGEGVSPLALAVIEQHADVVKALLKAGADPRRGPQGRNAIDAARAGKLEEMARLLSRYGPAR